VMPLFNLVKNSPRTPRIWQTWVNSPGPTLHLADELRRQPLMDLNASKKTLEEVERDYILRILEETRWKVGGKNSASEILGLNRSTLRARMRKLDIRKP